MHFDRPWDLLHWKKRFLAKCLLVHRRQRSMWNRWLQGFICVRKDTGLNTPITYTLITVWLTFLILLILHYSLGILHIKKTVKPIHSLDSSFLYSLLFFRNISNKHLDTSGAEASASLLLDNVSYLNVFQLLGGCMHTDTDGSRSEVMCVSFQSLTWKHYSDYGQNQSLSYASDGSPE